MSTPSPATTAKAGGSKSRRATLGSPAYLVKVEPVPPAPLLRVFVAGNPVSTNHMYGGRGYSSAKHLTAEARAWREAVS